MSPPPPISLIIPHFNDLHRLDTCLGAIAGQTYPLDRVEVIVVDNASPCGEAAVAAVIAGRARLALCPIKGAGPARNAGVALAGHALLAFTDSDCLADPGWLAAGVAALEDADLVGGGMKVTVRQPGRRSGAEAFEQVFGFNNQAYVVRENFTVTANLFTRADVFKAIGGFRAEVSEDKEWCQRAVAAGYRIAYAPAAIIRHPARSDWPELVRKWERMESESLALASERSGGRWRWLVRSWLLPASIAVHAPRVLRSPELDTVSERLRALGTLARCRLWRFANAQRIVWRRR